MRHDHLACFIAEHIRGPDDESDSTGDVSD